MKGFLSIVFLLFVSTGWAKSNLPDSLRQFLNREPKDSAYIIELNKLAFSCLKSSPEDGRELATNAITFSRQLNFKRGMARALDITGSSFWVVGDYESALKYYQLSAGESRKIRDSVGLSSIYHNIGEVYKKLGDYNQSIDFLNQSLLYYHKDRVHYGITLYNIGEAYLFKKEYSIALKYFEQSLASGISDKDNRTVAYSYHGLGIIESRKKKYKEALEYFIKAEKMWIAQGEKRSLIQTYVDISEVYVQLGHLQNALLYLDNTTRLANQIHAPDLQLINYKKISELLASQGNHKKALEVLQKHLDLKDSVYNIKKSESIRRLQAEFEADAREQENIQLKAEQQLKNSLIESQQKLIVGTVFGLVIAALLVTFLFRQRRKISEVNAALSHKNNEIEQQKLEIEKQAGALQRLNDTLQSLNRTLEDRIEERTHQLLRQNQKLAAYAHANAHQMRAPVASILGLLDLLDRIELSGDDKNLIRYLQQCGESLDKITRDIGKQLEAESLVK